jgi:hypothetical protein
MRQQTVTPPAGPPGTTTDTSTTGTTRALLACGVAAGPLFVVVGLAQMLTRDGFDPLRHPLSLLSLGDLGWIQIANFVLAGGLFVACAVGMRRVMRPGRGGTWGPLLGGVLPGDRRDQPDARPVLRPRPVLRGPGGLGGGRPGVDRGAGGAAAGRAARARLSAPGRPAAVVARPHRQQHRTDPKEPLQRALWTGGGLRGGRSWRRG